MSFSSDLKDLKRQRREELRSLHVTYLRTKRQIARATSPDRIIRKHLGAGLGIAALAGFLLAPRPSPSVRHVPQPEKTDHSGDGNFFKRLLHNIGPKVASFIPGMAPSDQAHHQPHPKRKGRLLLLIETLMPVLTLLLKKIDIQGLLEHFMGPRVPGENGDEPDVSVADAGTVKPSGFEDFN
ncbi:MAG TPA: hypothetical protein VH253_19215 [Phycisphaerae bacterium]|nr:hypothetical protein [Phycisphaerae bacterium]